MRAGQVPTSWNTSHVDASGWFRTLQPLQVIGVNSI
jgi:hypothetical protein